MCWKAEPCVAIAIPPRIRKSKRVIEIREEVEGRSKSKIPPPIHNQVLVRAVSLHLVAHHEDVRVCAIAATALTMDDVAVRHPHQAVHRVLARHERQVTCIAYSIQQHPVLRQRASDVDVCPAMRILLLNTRRIALPIEHGTAAIFATFVMILHRHQRILDILCAIVPLCLVRHVLV
eukprot:CAMPEP_0115313980 /NCGR_PEP_ID=MMETSP0270-20121206/76777_1 /TAXON_ID=71861 /ORGANISM="Scrippsiella trochoidea, Strain CCMP3099" /LENGTH=176 /DNA_ID=CAMNT_0002733153 /DNA_START=206 /DNA_END=736 /DNA_ORIENTATION=-